MIIQEATQVGSPIIRKKSKAIVLSRIKTKEIKKIVQDLIDSMHHHQLVGMAAPQIGKNLRIFVTEIRETQLRKADSDKEIDNLRVFINPQIISRSKKSTSRYEGCGSVAYAQIFATVSRPESVRVRAFDEKGERFVLGASGLLARVIQHELDHIDGKVFLDREFDSKSLMSKHEYIAKFKKK